MKKRVIALGFFDGVHLGHGALLNTAFMRAQATSASPCALLFDRHPSHILGKNPVSLLNTAEERALLMQRLYNISDVITLNFDEKMAAMPWDEFVRDILFKEFAASHVVCGFDFRFGYRGEGDTEKLTALCKTLGIGCDVVERVTYDGETVSSSVIRTLISSGDILRANQFLGHAHFICAPVEHGAELGRKIGIPTINQHFHEYSCIPKFGVYLTRLRHGGRTYKGVTNIGTRPTVTDEKIVKAETFILDFDGDLYEEKIQLELIDFIRPEMRFSDIDALTKQIKSDIENAKKLRIPD